MNTAAISPMTEFKIKFLGKSGKFIVIKSDEKTFHLSQLLAELADRKTDENDVTEVYENAYCFLMDVYSKKIKMAWGTKAECGGLLKPNAQDFHLGIFEVIEVINK